MGDFDLVGCKRGKCRSCDEPIVWTLTPKGHRMPLDPEPVADGTVVITGRILAGRDAGTPTNITLHAGDERQLDADRLRFFSHFKTCPNAGEHRRK